MRTNAAANHNDNDLDRNRRSFVSLCFADIGCTGFTPIHIAFGYQASNAAPPSDSGGGRMSPSLATQT